MARPREFDPRQTLQTAIEVFWEKGYFDASVDEIVKRSGVAKYGIYGTFGTKRELFIQALEQYGIDRRHDIQRPIRKPDASLAEIRQFFKRAPKIVTHRGNDRRGCLLCNTGVEIGANDAEARDIVKKFGEFAANQDVGLVIQPGEKHALLGENGAGKSTLVKMMYGVMQPTSGEFYWNGTRTVVHKPAEARELGISHSTDCSSINRSPHEPCQSLRRALVPWSSFPRTHSRDRSLQRSLPRSA